MMKTRTTPRISWLRRSPHWRLLAAGVAAALSAPLANAQPSAATRKLVPQTNAPSRPIAKNAPRPSGAPAKPSQIAQIPASPAAAPLPQWPVNDPAQEASVTWTAQGLGIQAHNSSLKQILDAVQSQLGVKIEGFDQDQDERVFGVYGPGQPREVLSQLLEGADYNLLMIGNGKNGVPQQILLSRKPAGGPQPNAPVAQGDMFQPPIAPYEPPRPMPRPPEMDSNQAPRAPQEILKEMQQRELIMRQQQLQQHRQQEQQQQ